MDLSLIWVYGINLGGFHFEQAALGMSDEWFTSPLRPSPARRRLPRAVASVRAGGEGEVTRESRDRSVGLQFEDRELLNLGPFPFLVFLQCFIFFNILRGSH